MAASVVDGSGARAHESGPVCEAGEGAGCAAHLRHGVQMEEIRPWGWWIGHGSRGSATQGLNVRAFGGKIQGVLVQQRTSNRTVSLAGKEADEDGLAPLEEMS